MLHLGQWSCKVDATKKLPQLLCAAGGPGSGKEEHLIPERMMPMILFGG